MTEPEAVKKVLENCNQPAVDTYVALIEEGKRQEAVQMLLADEGHWLTEAEANAFADYVYDHSQKQNDRS